MEHPEPTNPLDLIDSHAHLEMLADPAAAVAAARSAGVGQIVTIGVDLASSRQAAALAAAHPGVFATLGYHPHEAKDATAEDWPELLVLARAGRPVAVGECGLDYHYNLSPAPLQREVFARQIALARELGLPLVIHSREAGEKTLALLREQDAGPRGGVVHCFSGDPAQARQYLDLGFHLGVTGVITFPKSQVLREVARLAPLDRLLVETDCPYLAPVPHRGKPNQPAYIPLIAACLAGELGRPVAEVARITSQNARRLFGLPEAA